MALSTSSGRRSRRSLFATADCDLPSRRAHSSWLRPKSRMSCAMPRASSRKSRSLRWRFSTSAMKLASSRSSSMTMHGTSLSPAIRAARRRRSPATSSYPPCRGRTVSGLSTPYSAMLRESSSSCAGEKFCRGWTALGAIASTARYTMLPRAARLRWLENCIAHPPYLVFYNTKIIHILRKTRRNRARAEKKRADCLQSAKNRVVG